MSNLSNEQTLMTSDNGLITLTTHRVLEKSSNLKKELLLSEFISYEVVTKRVNYYKVLGIIFFVLSLVFGIWAMIKNQENQKFISRLQDAFNRNGISNNDTLQAITGIFTFSLFLFVISLLLYLTTGDKYLKITGRFSTLDFSIKNLGKTSLNKFTSALIVESDRRKRK